MWGVIVPVCCGAWVYPHTVNAACATGIRRGARHCALSGFAPLVVQQSLSSVCDDPARRAVPIRWDGAAGLLVGEAAWVRATPPLRRGCPVPVFPRRLRTNVPPVDAKGPHLPVLKHGPRSLTSMRVFGSSASPLNAQ